MSGAERQKRYRRRERDGVSVWRVELPDIAMTEALIAEGFITEADAQDYERAWLDVALQILDRHPGMTISDVISEDDPVVASRHALKRCVVLNAASYRLDRNDSLRSTTPA